MVIKTKFSQEVAKVDRNETDHDDVGVEFLSLGHNLFKSGADKTMIVMIKKRIQHLNQFQGCSGFSSHPESCIADQSAILFAN